ncbi:DnaT-like ssDNA-binding domain-containing protein [Pseudomonas sp. B15(2017)]|uniref:DnaT-like ssDNA-binding domain-containing protein n=1 Tax=Pseudomonas sp. B15(2017) TaxID=1981744 RepID=UPI002115A77B|nr:DnaT-like ssDNA-binding domain-containing protein [Pseudomonas sp. B15(2017)]
MDWFRLYGEFATDPKVQMMSEAMQRRLVMLFCLECSNGIETFHVTERETSIAFAMRVTEEILAETKAVFLAKGFINDDWTLANWEKRQYVSDSSTARVKAHREKKKKEAAERETRMKRSSNAPEQNRTDTEQKETPPPNAHDAFDSRTKFAMSEDWQPNEKSFPAAMTLNGLAGQVFDQDQFLEFKSFWIASPDDHRTQAKWEHALVQHLKRGMRNDQASGRTTDGRLNNASIRPARQGSLSAPDRVRAAIAERDAREAAARADGQAVDQNDGDVRPSLDGEFRSIG